MPASFPQIDLGKIKQYCCYQYKLNLIKGCSTTTLLVFPLRNYYSLDDFIVSYNYHPRMRVGNVFGHVCVSVCLSVQAITFESLDIETSFLVCRYILTISRSSLSIRVIGPRSRSYEKK